MWLLEGNDSISLHTIVVPNTDKASKWHAAIYGVMIAIICINHLNYDIARYIRTVHMV